MLNNIKVAFFLASRGIRRGNIWITIFTILVLTLIYIQLMFVSSFLGGVSQKFNDLIVDYQTGDIIIEPKSKDVFISDVSSLSKKIDHVPEIIGLSSRLKAGGSITYNEKSFATSIYGIEPDDESTVTKLSSAILAGDFLDPLDSGEIILGREVSGGYDAIMQAKSLGDVKVGDKVTVVINGKSMEFRVKGIYATLFFVADASAYINKADLEKILGVSDKASEIALKINSAFSESQIKSKLLDLGIKEEIRPWTDFAGILRMVTETFMKIRMVFNVIGLIVAFVVLFVVIYVNIMNKRRQIGVQKAIGAEPETIILSFLFMAFFYACVGIILGYLIIRFGLTNYTALHPFKMPLGYISLKVVGLQGIREAFLLFLAAVIGSIIPSYKMAHKNLLDLIRS